MGNTKENGRCCVTTVRMLKESRALVSLRNRRPAVSILLGKSPYNTLGAYLRTLSAGSAF